MKSRTRVVGLVLAALTTLTTLSACATDDFRSKLLDAGYTSIQEVKKATGATDQPWLRLLRQRVTLRTSAMDPA